MSLLPRRFCILALAAAGWALVLVACGVPGNSSFSRTDTDKIPFGLADTTTTTSTTTTTTTVPIIAPSTTLEPVPTIAFVNVPLYFVAGKQIVSVTKPLVAPASLAQVLSVLESGPPPGDVAIGLSSAIPAGTQTAAVEDRGVVTVNLPTAFFTNMTPQDQRLAIAQYVLTLTELTGVGQVTFTQEAAPIAVLGGGGELTEVGQLMAHKDYERLLLAGAPEVTTPPPATETTLTVP